MWSSFPALCLVILLIILNSIFTNNFISTSFASSFFTSYTPLIIVAIAQTIVIIGKGIDLSVGGIISLVNVVIVSMVGLGYTLSSAFVAGLLTGIIIGALNGFVIGYFRVTPLLATLATSSIAGGIALWIMPFPGGQISMDFILWYQDILIGLIPSPILFIIISLIIWLLWKFTPLGLTLYAMGRDINKTYASGISVNKIQFLTYVSSGMLSSIAAIALTANTGAGDPLIGSTYTLYAVAASVVGGISLYGGIGDAFGAIFGAVFLGLAFTLVFSLHIPSFYQDLASGVIVLLGIIGAAIVKLNNSKVITT